MGADESKPGDGAVQGGAYRLSYPHFGDTPAWTLLHQCTLDKWEDGGHAEAAGFKENVFSCEGALYKDCSPTFCIKRQEIVNIKSTTNFFSFRKRSKFTKMAEHFEYNYIPAQLSSIQNFHVKSVLCYRENIVVLHLIRNFTSQFGVIHLKANKFLGSFRSNFNMIFVNEQVRGQLSPDCSKCILMLPVASSSEYLVHVYDLHRKGFPRMSEVKIHTGFSHFCFDPRFSWNRIAMTNYEVDTVNSLSLIELKTWDVIATNPKADDTRASLYPNLRDLTYTPDGSLIVAFSMDTACHCQEKKTRQNPLACSVFVFNGDKATTLHCIEYVRYTCGQHLCPVNYLPVFSVCGSRMAIAVNNPNCPLTTYVQVYNLPKPINLQGLCRTVILQVFPEDKLENLPLPARVIAYLQFKSF